MNESVEKAQVAWQPLTGRGVAAFARASLARLLLVQFIVALVAAGSVVWFLHQDWFPIIGEAIHQLPPQGELRSGRLDWQGPTPSRLAEGRFLALVVDLDHGGEARSPAQVQVEFGRTDWQVFSLLGYVQGAYPPGWTMAFNRTDLGPWWGAWAPAILAIVAGLVVGSLMLSWAGLATTYCLPAWLVGFFANRDLSLCGSWRLAGAALMPGALLLSAAIVLYGWGVLDLVRLAAAVVVHLLMGWIYLIVSPLRLPRRPAAAKENPFA
ncbi:MAG: hypothetical protein ACLQU3_26325 [Limisphaerales bacterium]